MAIDSLLSNRLWQLHFSFLKRNCYISGVPLKFQWAYRGRKKLWYPVLYGDKAINDDLWLSQKEYLYLLSKGKI